MDYLRIRIWNYSLEIICANISLQFSFLDACADYFVFFSGKNCVMDYFLQKQPILQCGVVCMLVPILPLWDRLCLLVLINRPQDLH